MAIPFVFPNYAHQEREWDEHRREPGRALFWQMRTGKSKAMVDLACDLFSSFEIDGVLILAPNKVHTNWIRNEFPRHSWMPCYGHAWSSENRHLDWHKAGVKRVCTGRGELSVLAINNRALLLEDAKKVIHHFVHYKRVMLIVDESHHYRGAGSKRSRRARPLAKRCPWRRILTGTATADSPKGLWAMMELVAPGALGFTKYKDYLSYFFVEKIAKDRSGRSWTTHEFNEARKGELQERLSKWATVVLRKDCEDLPSLVNTRRYFDLDPQLQRVYDVTRDEEAFRLERDYGVLLDLDSAMKRLLKLQQITSGWVYQDDGTVKDLSVGGNPRMEALLEVLNEAPGKKHMVWCQFKEDCRQVRARLDQEGFPAVEFHGDVSDDQKDVAEAAFRNDPAILVMVAHPAACGEGLDFSAANRMVWYSHTWRLTHREQASERCTKMGGEDVEVIDLVAARTVDERILAALEAKKNIAEFLTGAGLQELLAFLGGP